MSGASFSLIASCKMNGIDPFAYLVDVLHRLPLTPESELGELAPHRWTKQQEIATSK